MIIKAVKFRKDGFYTQPFVFGGEEGAPNYWYEVTMGKMMADGFNDETKELWDQDLDRKSIAILSYLNMEYLVNKEQKELLKEMHRFNERKKYSK